MPRRIAPSSTHQHLILYDGECGLCQGVVQFVLRHDRARVCDFASLQGDAGRAVLRRFGRTSDALDTFVLVEHYRQPSAVLRDRADAALCLAGSLPWPWRAATLLRALPVPLRDGVYNLVARHRYRIGGTRDYCTLPDEEHAGRFLDRLGPTLTASEAPQ